MPPKDKGKKRQPSKFKTRPEKKFKEEEKVPKEGDKESLVILKRHYRDWSKAVFLHMIIG